MLIYIYIPFSLFLSLDGLECWQQYHGFLRLWTFRLGCFRQS